MTRISIARPDGLRLVMVISRTSLPATRPAMRRASSRAGTRRTHSVQADSRSNVGPSGVELHPEREEAPAVACNQRSAVPGAKAEAAGRE